MKKRKTCYALRAHRRRLGLSQQEMATLLGLESAANISHIEHGRRDPSFATAFACAALFGAPLCELFPHITKEAREGLKERAGVLCERIDCVSTPHAAHKAQFLGTVPSTAFHEFIHHEV